MKFTSALALLIAPLAFTATTQAATSDTARTGNAVAVTKEGVSVISDANCIYPFAKSSFDATQFAGPTPEDRKQWYTWAATNSRFQQGCSCDSASYGTFANGSIALTNTCIRKGASVSVSGYADPVEDFAVGSYKAFVGPTPPASDCAGPNFIVQETYFNKPGQPKVTDGKGAYETVIIGSSNLDKFWILSKTRKAKRGVIDDYLEDVWRFGYNKTQAWSYTNQAKCRSRAFSVHY